MTEFGERVIPRTKEFLDPSIAIECANSYGTRGRPYELTVNGRQEVWHSLKGGLNPSKDTGFKGKNASYEILWSPESKRWLKVVPPETRSDPVHYQRLRDRLHLSTVIAKSALEVAGVPHLRSDFNECSVQIRGQEAYGFVSPHIGPSVQYFLERFEKPARNSLAEQQIDHEVFTDIYNIAFDEAALLYLRHGYWMADPNPGNILVHDEKDGAHVVLIDFSNQTQTELIDFGIPADKITHGEFEGKMNKLLFRNVKRLSNIFSRQCNQNDIAFSPDLDFYRENSFAIAREQPDIKAA